MTACQLGYRIVDVASGSYFIRGQYEFSKGIGKVYSSSLHAEKRKAQIEGQMKDIKRRGYSSSLHLPEGPFEVKECYVYDSPPY